MALVAALVEVVEEAALLAYGRSGASGAGDNAVALLMRARGFSSTGGFAGPPVVIVTV